MSKNKDIKVMEIKYFLTNKGKLKPNLKFLKLFQQDLTENQINLLINKINELTDVVYSNMEEILKKIDEEEENMFQKDNNKIAKECINCEYCIPIGEGDHICEENPHKIVLDDYIPSDDYNWCNGRYFRRR